MFGVFHLDEVASVLELRVPGGGGAVGDGVRGHAECLEHVLDLYCAVSGGPTEMMPLSSSSLVWRAARSAKRSSQVSSPHAHGGAEVGPVGVVAHGDGDPVVVARGGVASVGRHVGVGVADELGHSGR